MRGLINDVRVSYWRIGRKRKIAVYLRSHTPKSLHIGASNNILPGWLNTEIFLTHTPLVYLDATKRFPFADNALDYIMSEHMIEHIDYEAGLSMLRECFRVLRPNGRVRISTPDLQVLLALYCAEKTLAQKHYIDWAVARFLPGVLTCKDVFVINNFFRSWGHQFLYDAPTLQHALTIAGFKDIRFFRPGQSQDPLLQNLESHGKELGSEEINRFETIVVEGSKKN
jgi:predicted SAM-dependent methyltransferase